MNETDKGDAVGVALKHGANEASAGSRLFQAIESSALARELHSRAEESRGLNPNKPRSSPQNRFANLKAGTQRGKNNLPQPLPFAGTGDKGSPQGQWGAAA